MKNGLKVDQYGNKSWYKNGKYHREDGPACEYANGDKFWYKSGKQHREDGPAVELNNGTYFEYWLDGKQLNFPNDTRLTKEQMELHIAFM